MLPSREPEELPAALAQLTTATTRLRLRAPPTCRNYITGGWQHLRPLAGGLQALELRAFNLPELPAVLSELTALTALAVGGNPIGYWDTGTSSLQYLQPLARLADLDLHNCSLRELPAALAQLTALTRLDLAANQRLTGGTAAGWQHLRPLRQLRELSAACCGLQQLPPDFSALTALTRLSLASNDGLKGGWEHLQPLQQLADLSLDNCGLREVPEGLSHLVGLARLDLGRNREWLGAGHQHLRRLPVLECLRVRLTGLADSEDWHAVAQLRAGLPSLTSLLLD